MITDGTVERWLAEDLGHHDVTNDVPGEMTGRLVATEEGVAAGVDAAAAVFRLLDVDVDQSAEAGDALEAGETLLEVHGPARSVLRAERVAVNVAGHASGIATKTRTAVETVEAVDPAVRVAGTRKTTPGLRGLEKRAIAAGGGDTHRLDLSHMVMVKDNHIAELGIDAAVERFREQVSFATKIEVEVAVPEDASRAAAAGADAVLFDNLPPSAVTEGVETLPDDVIAEASGGIDMDTLAEYAATGVDVVSMGRLTHSAPALDLSFRAG